MAYRLVRMSNLSDPPVNCKVVLSREKDIYEPGDKVEGIVIVSHQRDLILHGFKVVLEGTSLTKFKEREIVHSKSEEFLAEYQYVFGQERQKTRLAGGGTAAKVHKFPLSLKIPLETLPGSFKSQFGITLYQIVVYMHMDVTRFVKKAEKTINVNGQLTLPETSLMPTIFDKSFRRFKFKLSMPQSGYLAGEEIPFEFELDNPNGYEIANIVVSLVQKTIYKTGNISRLAKTYSTTLASIETARCDSAYGTFWANGLRIPTKQRPSQNGIIEIQYVLKAEVNTTGEAGSLRADTPIIIGTTRTALTIGVGRSTSSGIIGVGNVVVTPIHPETISSRNGNNGGYARNDEYVMPGVKKERPPSYSALSLRRSSLSKSLETLPPEYTDIVFENGEGEIEKLDSMVI